MLKMMQRVVYLPNFIEKESVSQGPALRVLYSQKQTGNSKAAQKLQKAVEKSHEFGYGLEKEYLDGREEEVLERLGMTQEELNLRKEHNATLLFYRGDEFFKIPIGTPEKDIDAWVAKCQKPFIDVDSLAALLAFSRKIILDDDNYILLVYKLTEEQKQVVETYSRLKYRTPVLQVDSSIAESFGMKPGVAILKPYSKFDGDFDIDNQGKLKALNLTNKNFTLEELEKWVNEFSTCKVYHCSNFDKIFPMFTKIYQGPQRVLYVLTSQMNTHSENYEHMLKTLVEIAEEHKDQLKVAIIPEDEMARKLGMVRKDRLRRARQPEARLIDFNVFVSTEPSGEGNFPEIDCKQEGVDCKGLSEDNYLKKTCFREEFSRVNLDNFIKKSLEKELPQYYEVEENMRKYVKKLNARNFRQEVIQNEKDVLLEIYGKYCPACVVFKNNYDELAGEFKVHKDQIEVAKVCKDENVIPEITDKTPYTPIFWLYKAGDKENPVQYQGGLNTEDIKNFLKENTTKQI